MEETNRPSLGTKKSFSPLLIIGVVVVFAVVGYFVMTKNKSTVTPQTSNPTESSQALKTITMDDVTKHADKNSCWMVIEGSVYDVTLYAPKHPGEEAIFLGCGKDATIIFNKRPNDGTSHSDRARVQLEKYKIGVLSSS
jgi:cytochrome b involved in lipid metabolism